MLQGAIFDVDGTLLDSMAMWDHLGEIYLREKGMVPEADLSRVLLPMTLEEGARYLKAHYELRESVKGIRRGILRVIEKFYREEVPLKRGAAEFLNELRRRHVPLALATAGDGALTRAALRRLGVIDHFQAILTCTELGTDKQEDVIYREAARFLRSDITRTAVFEDALYALSTAKRAGFIAVGVKDDSSRADQADIISLSDVYLADFAHADAFWTLIDAR